MNARASARRWLDARDVLTNPQGMLSALCDAIGIPFDDAMLTWPAGARDSDGVWAVHWYHNVETSTGFTPYKQPETRLSPTQKTLAKACEVPYQALYRPRLQA